MAFLLAGGVIDLIAIGLSRVEQTQPVAVGLYLIAALLFFHPLYLPNVELLRPHQKTRWSRWSRYVLALLTAWLIGSLAVPFFGG